jgi:hypothetical protein
MRPSSVATLIPRAWVLILLAGCVDKAKADYDRCVERDQNYDVKGARESCQAAVAADPKSVSGQAAAKKLLDLDRVADKLAIEQKEKSDRDEKIKKAEPPLVIVHSASTVSAPPPTPLDQENALMAQGNKDGARQMITERMLTNAATKEEAKLLKDICTAQKDKSCLKLLVKYKPN